MVPSSHSIIITKFSISLLLFTAYLFVCQLYMVRYSWKSSVQHIEICCKKLLENLANIVSRQPEEQDSH